MKITKRQLRRIIKEEYSSLLGEDAGAVNAIIDDIQPDMEKMSKTELDLLSMNLDRLIAQLGGSKNESVRIIRNRLKRIIREEKAKLQEVEWPQAGALEPAVKEVLSILQSMRVEERNAEIYYIIDELENLANRG